MEDSKSRDPSEIKIVDRRKFTAEGARRDDVPETDDDAPDVEPPPTGPTGGGSGDRTAERQDPTGFEHRPVDEPEGVDFTLLINAMAQPVVILLDEVPHEDPRENQGRLEQARLQIDLLDLLRVKCRGNLTSDEERLLEQVLYRLRMLYVQKRGGG